MRDSLLRPSDAVLTGFLLVADTLVNVITSLVITRQ